MDKSEIKKTFEAYFEKYKKTEGDGESWSAVFSDHTPKGRLDINVTKCPDGTSFKIFKDNDKLAEVQGWDGFFEYVPELQEKHPGLYDQERFFSAMQEMT